MKEFKFTGTMRPERIQPNDNFRLIYQSFRRELVTRTNPYPEVEVIIRARDPRQDWIDKWYNKAVWNTAVRCVYRKDVVIAVDDDGNLATAAPVRGDKYDRHTGIAVAYAKLYGEPVPDYI